MHDGVPEWFPPSWVDPQRKPIRNTAHHLLDYDFSAAVRRRCPHGFGRHAGLTPLSLSAPGATLRAWINASAS
jgi:hypothetical protein